MIRHARPFATAAATGLLVLSAGAAAAQTPSPAWKVSVVGGLSVFEVPTSGTAALPPPGPSLPTSGPTNPSRRVPTWFLGDGASLLNGTNEEFGVAARLSPLDPALARLGLSGTNAPVGGLRLSRALGRRWAIELGVELHTGALELDPVLLDAAQAAVTSFKTAFTGLLTTGPFTNVSVTSALSATGTSSRELGTTGSVQFTLRPGSVSPYITAGGGLLHRLGDLPTITLTGDYRFTFATSQGSASFAEADNLSLRFTQGTRVVGIAGAGVSARVGDRFDMLIDGRAYIGSPTLTLTLDASPSVTTATPAGFIESFTTPAVQFSNNSSTGRASTLSGAPLQGFEAFSATGIQVRYVITAGLSVRF